MNNSKTLVGSQKGMSKLVTARFGPGMLLQHDDLEQLSSYTRDLSQLLFRSFFGCGVVCGLNVDASKDGRRVKVIVSPGLALACSGEPISVPDEQTVLLGEDCSQDIPPKLWVVLCSTNVSCAPRNPACAEDEMQPECTRIRKGFEIRVVSERPSCACGCPEPTPSDPQPKDDPCRCVDPNHACYKPHYEGVCGCKDDTCCDCACVLVGRLELIKSNQETYWQTDYRVRRFIRPVLMRDPKPAPKQRDSINPAAGGNTAQGNGTSGQGNGANAQSNGGNEQGNGANGQGGGENEQGNGVNGQGAAGGADNQLQGPTPPSDVSANAQEQLKALTEQLQKIAAEKERLDTLLSDLKKQIEEVGTPTPVPAIEPPQVGTPAVAGQGRRRRNSASNPQQPTATSTAAGNNDPPAATGETATTPATPT